MQRSANMKIFLQQLSKRMKMTLWSTTLDKNSRLDKFVGVYLHKNNKFQSLWEVCVYVFTLSHGQSQIERGFNTNKEMLVENLQQLSLKSQRIVHDHITSLGVTVDEFVISNELLLNCKTACTKYKSALEDVIKAEVEDAKTKKRKLITEEIQDVKRRKLTLESCIKSLETETEKYYDSVETEYDLTTLTKANSFKKSAKEKKLTLVELANALIKLGHKIRRVYSVFYWCILQTFL